MRISILIILNQEVFLCLVSTQFSCFSYVKVINISDIYIKRQVKLFFLIVILNTNAYILNEVHWILQILVSHVQHRFVLATSGQLTLLRLHFMHYYYPLNVQNNAQSSIFISCLLRCSPLMTIIMFITLAFYQIKP